MKALTTLDRAHLVSGSIFKGIDIQVIPTCMMSGWFLCVFTIHLANSQLAFLKIVNFTVWLEPVQAWSGHQCISFNQFPECRSKTHLIQSSTSTTLIRSSFTFCKTHSEFHRRLEISFKKNRAYPLFCGLLFIPAVLTELRLKSCGAPIRKSVIGTKRRYKFFAIEKVFTFHPVTIF